MSPSETHLVVSTVRIQLLKGRMFYQNFVSAIIMVHNDIMRGQPWLVLIRMLHLVLFSAFLK